MSSNHNDRSEAASRAEPGRVVRLLRPRTWTLRSRLTAVVAALGVGLCLAVGTGTLIALRHYLIDQLDGLVQDAQSRSTTIFQLGPPPFVRFAGPGPMFLDAPGQSAGTVGGVISGPTTTEAAVITTTGNRQQLGSRALTQLEHLPLGRNVSVHLDGIGPYRVIAQRIPNSDAVVVSGLPLSGVRETLESASWIICGSSLVALLIVVATGIVMIRRELVPLSRMSTAAQHVAGLPLHTGEVSLPTPIERVDEAAAHTEVGRLGTALNMMVDRVADGLAARQASETRVRQFVADASHELRTPLTSIRGYTEISRRLVRGISEDVPHRDDLVYALTRVHAESRRMSQLVEDMLLLARLDAGRPLERDEVDLSELVLDAVSDAHIAGPEHRWPLELPDESVVVVGDRLRLHQVLGNLLANARVHTPPGTRVVTALVRNADDSVAISVTDDGPGIPDELMPEVFERFARGDGSRSRTAGGSGLGLAIAFAVVKAHGGSIDAASSSDGTSFTVRLPRSRPADADSGIPSMSSR